MHCPNIFEQFKDAIIFRRKEVTLDEVTTMLKTKDLQKQRELKEESQDEGLNARGRTKKRDHKGKGSKSRLKSKNGNSEQRGKSKWKCFHCHKEGHFKKDCPERKKKGANRQNEQSTIAVANGYDSAKALIFHIGDSCKEWVLDSGCLFHMCPNKSWFEEIEIEEGGSVLLENKVSCKVLV